MAVAVLASCSSSSIAKPQGSPSTPTPSPSASLLPCAQPAAAARAGGVSSSDPVLLLASGLSAPDDLLYVGDDGSVLVGEHGDGHIARITAPGTITRLPQVVPEVEGIAEAGGTFYVADQYHARVDALTASGVRTVLQLVPVASGENLDGISADNQGTGLVVPDSPHGTVLFVDPSGHVTRTVGGFSRPAGAATDPNHQGYLIADENASAVYEIVNGRVTRIAGGLPGVDDVVREQDDHVIAILPGYGRMVDVTGGRALATGLRNPQGLGFDGAQNLLVTESDAGRVDLVVRTYAAQAPSGVVQLQRGQPVCIGVLRAPGYTSNVRIFESIGAVPLSDPGAGDQAEVVPGTCAQASCTVTVLLRSNEGDEFARFAYRD